MSLIALIAIILVVAVIVWATQHMAVPAPINWVVYAVVLFVLLVVLLNLAGINVGSLNLK